VSAPAVPADRLLAPAYQPDRATGWWAMACVCATEAAFFAYLITAYWYLAMRSPHWPPPGIRAPTLPTPLLMTAALLSSSVAMWWGERGTKRGNQRQVVAGLVGAVALGLTFVVLFITEYWHKLQELLPQTHVYGSLFYVITGVHGLHVIFGLLLISYTLLRVVRSEFDPRRYRIVSTTALYWHFVDIVWLVIVTNLYLTPRFA
jgi:heme/copper-type cytochrome/quinol oxidase subunit 3